jgi:TMEM175 potassium channel family protein
LANTDAGSKGRLEAFSDGVIAVAITLLALNLNVPPPPTGDLAHELAKEWPQYAAYATSFITIGIIWINHHAAIGRLREPDHVILVLNLFLLLWIAELPFATNLMATYLREGSGEHLAAVVYAGSYLAMSLTFVALNRHILFPKSHLLVTPLSLERRRQILSRGATGLIPYTLATVLALVSPYITLILCAAVAAFYALPLASGSEKTEEALF